MVQGEITEAWARVKCGVGDKESYLGHILGVKYRDY